MRITTPSALLADDSHPLRFKGSRNEDIQIHVLDHDLIRVCHRPDGFPRLDRTWLVVGKDGDVPLEGRARDDLSPFAQPAYDLKKSDNRIDVQTQQLKLTIHTDDFQLEWRSADGKPFAADLRQRAYSYDRDGKAVFHYMQRRSDEHYYGFGERSGVLDKQGMRLRMLNVDALGYNAETSDPLYKHFPFYITYIPQLKIAYGLFYDNLATTVFDMGKEIDAFWGFYRYYMADDGDLDYTMIYGPSIEAVIEKFTALVGRPTLPPRWSLGYLGSTMSYTEAPDAQVQLKRFIELCQKHDIPCDMFHLSSGYSTDDKGTRYVFTWNRNKVPQPQQMSQDFHDAGIHLAANIKPYLLKDHPHYEEVKALGGFVKDSDSDDPALSNFWSGGAFQAGAGSYIDFTGTAGFNWWKAHFTSALLDFGIDCAWNDNNEFEIWDDKARCDGFGNDIPISMARPLQTLLMARSSYEATLEHKPDMRPFVLSRSGCPGIQRYAQTWSGDNETSWHTLRYNVPMGLGLSLSGAPSTGHDVGGFFGPAPDAELFVRWVQNGIFHPRFTIHSWNTDGTVNEPWMHNDVLSIVKEYFDLRYRLIPYLYTLFHEAHRTGHPIIRPMVYHFPDDPHCHTESFNFMLGANLLVASVFEAGARTRQVYLPAGKAWCDFHTGEWYEGGQTIEVDAPLQRIPLFVREGGMIPMSEGKNNEQRLVHVCPRKGRSTFTLIEDDGVSFGYQRGEYTKVHLEVKMTDNDITFSARRGHNGYPLPYDRVYFTLNTDISGLTVKGGDSDENYVIVPVE